MKRFLPMIVLFFLTINILGCNVKDKNEEKDFNCNQLTIELKTLNNEVENNREIENNKINDLAKKIINMSVVEFQKFASNCNSFSHRNCTFVFFEENICIAVKYSKDYLKIAEVKVFEKFIAETSKVNEIVMGMDIFEVISLIGNPYGVRTSGLSSLDFEIENKQSVRIILDLNMCVSEIQYIDIK